MHLSGSRRIVIVGGPAGYLSAHAAGSAMLRERLAGGRWVALVTLNVPRRRFRAGVPPWRLVAEAQEWVLRTHELV